MFPSTSFTLLPQEHTHNLDQHPRRLLLQTPFYPPPPPPLPLAPDYQPHPSTSHAGFNANVVMVLTVLLFALVCSLCVNSLVRCAVKCPRMVIREPNYNTSMVTQEEISSGLDKRALRTFPVVKYSKEMKIQGLNLGADCVICLSEFEGEERVRILPKCNHGFHVKCIDKWLSSHSSCPTCRQSLVDTCQKIIGCDDHQASSSSSSSSLSLSPAGGTEERISISVAPLEREDLVRNYRGQNGQN